MKNGPVSIARDPFGRSETIRVCVPARERIECLECGQPGRFRYGTADDQGRSYISTKVFCSVSCRRAYVL